MKNKRKRKSAPIRKAYRRIDASELLEIFEMEIRLSPAAGGSLKKHSPEQPPFIEACEELAEWISCSFSPLGDKQQSLYEEVKAAAAKLNAAIKRWLDMGGGWQPWPEIQQSLDVVGAAPVLSNKQKQLGQPPKEWHAYARALAPRLKAALVDAGNKTLVETNPESLVARIGARLINRLFIYEQLGSDRNPKPLRITAEMFADAVRARPSRGKRQSDADAFPNAVRIKVLD